MIKKQEQWEGFQQFCQSTNSDPNPNSSPSVDPQPLPQPPQCQSQPEPQWQTQTGTSSQKPKTSPYKKTKKIKFLQTSPTKQPSQSNLNLHGNSLQNDNQHDITNQSQLANVHFGKLQKQKERDREREREKEKQKERMARIPIMKKQDQYRFMGNIVYRAFVPRSSDSFFRNFKDVNYEKCKDNEKDKDKKQVSGNANINEKANGNTTVGSTLNGGRVNFKVAILILFFKVGEAEFDLYMRVDTNTNGHRQWFYFRVRNGYAGVVRFNIFRFKKKFSLFQRGMKPYVLSVKSKKGWQPACTKIQYKTEKPLNDYNKSQNESPSYYLTFQYKFEQAQDEVYFASGLPYTVSFLGKRLTEFKQKIKQIKNQKIQYQISEIGKSLCGQKLPLVTICGKYQKDQENQRKSGQEKYNYIIINARTHAGQTASSWVLDGFLEKIVKDQAIKDWIVGNRICFKIVPMLNPDGVFVGNYRTGVVGDDFNRKFASGKKDLFPQIFALKKLISQCKRLGRVFLFLDLHGHSILKNSFIYGPSETLFTTHPLRNLPFSIWHNSKYFRLSSCKFKFSKDMAQTARIYFQIKQNILTYTCQTSLGLYYQGTNTIQMLQSDYQSLGSGIVQSIFQLLTKEKIENYKEHQEITTVVQKNIEFNQAYNDNKLLPKYFSKPKDKEKQKQLQSRTTLSTKRQKLRQTCLQKIKTIKKQLNQQSKQQQIIIAKQIEKADRLATKKLAQTLLPQPITKIIAEDHQTKKSTPKSYLHSHHNSFQLYPTQPNKNQQKQQLQPQDPHQPSHQPQLSPQPQPQHQLASSPTKQKISHPHPHLHLKIKNKNTKQAQFKIRRKSDVLKIIPESIRKKLGIRIEFSLLSTKHMGFDYGSFKDTGGVGTGMGTRDGKHLRKGSGNGADGAQEEFRFQRSATYDSSYLSTQIQAIREKEDEQPNLQIINQKFSQQYQSMNDSDGSSCDLEYKQKQYLIQCIKNTKKTNPDLNPQLPQQQPQFSHPTNPNGPPFSNINGFKQIRFKSIDAPQKNSILPFRSTKRQPHKFRDLTHKSLGRNLYEEDNGLMAQMVQKKQLNQRGSGGQGNGANARKIGREPYFLVQIKNKNCESLGIGVAK